MATNIPYFEKCIVKVLFNHNFWILHHICKHIGSCMIYIYISCSRQVLRSSITTADQDPNTCTRVSAFYHYHHLHHHQPHHYHYHYLYDYLAPTRARTRAYACSRTCVRCNACACAHTHACAGTHTHMHTQGTVRLLQDGRMWFSTKYSELQATL